jgi:hypothetical protein
MRDVYLAQLEVGGEPLTLGGRLPTEEAHVVIASVILMAVGVEAEPLDAVGWSPLLPLEMRRIRGALALKLTPPDLEQAQASRALYESIRAFDELFFRAWRLAGKRAAGPSQGRLVAEAEDTWSQVLRLARQTYGDAEARR